MAGFKGLQAYQQFRRKDWFDKGYILLSPITGHKAFIWDHEELKRMKARMNGEGFWDEYREAKRTNPSSEIVQAVRNFFKRRSDWERCSINYPIQAGGSMCLRLTLIKFFDYLRDNDLLFSVKTTIIPYDGALS